MLTLGWRRLKFKENMFFEESLLNVLDVQQKYVFCFVLSAR